MCQCTAGAARAARSASAGAATPPTGGTCGRAAPARATSATATACAARAARTRSGRCCSASRSASRRRCGRGSSTGATRRSGTTGRRSGAAAAARRGGATPTRRRSPPPSARAATTASTATSASTARPRSCCLVQRSGRGRCRQGHRTCDPGWWGVDCSLATLPPPAPPPPGVHRALRPRVYVYEMPAEFTTALRQRRHDKLFCVPRTYLKDNRTQYAYGIYQGYVLEVLLHEWLLASPHPHARPRRGRLVLRASVRVVRDRHRHLRDAELDADASPPRPRLAAVRARPRPRPQRPSVLGRVGRCRPRVDLWLRRGRACFAPRELWPSMLISHWGGAAKHNRCTTTYDPAPLGRCARPDVAAAARPRRGRSACYDPKKDVVITRSDLSRPRHLLPPRATSAAARRAAPLPLLLRG